MSSTTTTRTTTTKSSDSDTNSSSGSNNDSSSGEDGNSDRTVEEADNVEPQFLNSYDFTATPELWKPLGDQKKEKAYIIQRKSGDRRKVCMTFTRDACDTIFDLVASKLDVKKTKDLLITYGLKKEDGSVEQITVMYDKDPECLKDSLQLLYCQATEMSTLVIELENELKLKSKRLKRERRSDESLFREYVTRHKTVDVTFFEKYLNDEIVEDFLKKRRLLRIIMGSATCINFLNPAYYHCHVVGCPKASVTLRCYNSIASIRDHWKAHCLKDDPSTKYRFDESCSMLLQRNDFVTSHRGAHLGYVTSEFVNNSIQELEAAKYDSGNGLGILHLIQNKLVFEESKFPGKPLYVSDEILQKLMEGDESCLSSI